jgi:hypothetical protein
MCLLGFLKKFHAVPLQPRAGLAGLRSTVSSLNGYFCAATRDCSVDLSVGCEKPERERDGPADQVDVVGTTRPNTLGSMTRPRAYSSATVRAVSQMDEAQAKHVIGAA